MRTKQLISLLCLCAALSAGSHACAAETEASGNRAPAGSGSAGAGAGTGGVGAPAASHCSASNVTQRCTCDDGMPGRQICIEASGWGACDCGEGAASSGDLLTTNANPPANMDTAITFADYVKPKMLNPGDCKPGNYVGTFTCSYAGPLSPEPFMISGLVSLALDRSANSEVLEIKDGALDGWGFVFFFAYLTGTLNCATGDITGAATEGFYNPLIKGCSGAAGDMPGVNCVISDKSDPGYVPWTVSLSGSYGGTLDPSTDTISGTWSLMPDSGGSCDGTFMVTHMP